MDKQPEEPVGETVLNDVQRSAQEQFSRQSHRYGKGHVLEDVADVQAALSIMSLRTPSDALDVATGAGHTGLHLASLGHRVTATDLTIPMLDRVREAAARRGLSVATRQHAAEQFPFADGSFDLVTCRVAAHHFSSPPDFVGESARVLRPGGWFLLIDGSVEDGEPEAEEWMHQIEKLRDPSHARLLTPGRWRELCRAAGLTVVHVGLAPFKQPDLEWYFETAATSGENRRKVRELIANAPAPARRLFQLADEGGKIVWWWQRLTLVARKPGAER